MAALVRFAFVLVRVAVAFASRHRGLTITLLITWWIASEGQGW